MPTGTVIDHFEIDDALAKELSDLLTTQSIREKVLSELVSNNKMNEYAEMEKSLIPVVNKIEAIKYRITNEFVPLKYRSAKYSWNYNGYEIDKNIVEILG